MLDQHLSNLKDGNIQTSPNLQCEFDIVLKFNILKIAVILKELTIFLAKNPT